MSTTSFRQNLFGILLVLVLFSVAFAQYAVVQPIDQTNVKCTDSGTSFFNKDSVSCSNGSKFVDFCVNSTHRNEYYVYGDSIANVGGKAGFGWYSCPAGTSCSDGACVNLAPSPTPSLTQPSASSQAVTCTDPANSKTPGEKDEVTCTNGTVAVDYCIGPTSVLEYHLSGTKQLTSTVMPCNFGTVCYDGACMFSNKAQALKKEGTTEVPISCSDSDSGQNSGVSGTMDYLFSVGTLNYAHTFKDVCADSGSVIERYCDTGKGKNITLSCGDGFSCSEGACVKFSPPANTASASSSVPGSSTGAQAVETPVSCSDTDGGKDNLVFGVVNYSFTKGAESYNVILTDKCIDNNVNVSEHFCGSNNKAYTISSPCGIGYSCSNGACVKLSIPMPSLTIPTKVETPLSSVADSAPLTVASSAADTKPTVTPKPVSGLTVKTEAPEQGKKIANCKKSGGENIYNKDKITWTAYVGSSVTPSVNEDVCTSDMRLAEWVCNNVTSPIIKYIDCPSGYSCSGGACVLAPGASTAVMPTTDKAEATSTSAPTSATSVTPTTGATETPTSRPRPGVSVTPTESSTTSSATGSSSVCRDNDGGLEYRIAGRVTCTDGRSFEDNCANSRTLVEYYERGGTMKSTRVVCSRLEEGYSCVRGACAKSGSVGSGASNSASGSVVPQTTAKTPAVKDVISKGIAPSVVPTVTSNVPPKAELRYECADSDGGMDIKTKGTTREALITEDGTRTESAYRDACEGDMRVREYFCSGNRVKSKTMRCSITERCDDGICVRSSDSVRRSASSESASASQSSSPRSSTRRGNVLTTWDTSPVEELVGRR